jgi:Spy/CpxP family protein refolding chaperone
MSAPTIKYTSANLVRMLSNRHADAVFIDECKMGSSWNGTERLDAWVLLKTWSPMTAVGYEIKVSRSDFLRDTKWQRYLSVCHEFYFVAPKGVLTAAELPEQVGLLEPAGQRLVCRRKATRREPNALDLVSLMAYALMSRSRTVANWHDANSGGKVEFWRGWLADKIETQRVGHAASKRLREIVDDERRKRREAEQERDRLQGVKDTLAALGFDGNAAEWNVKNAASRAPLFTALQQIGQYAARISSAVEREVSEERARSRADLGRPA